MTKRGTAWKVRRMPAVAQAAVAVACLGVAAPPAQAEDLPTFRRGLWEFDRTVEMGRDMGSGPKTISSRRCTEPGEDMKRQQAMFAKSGCTVSPVTRRGSVYSFVADCKGAGVGTVVSQSVITVESDSAYTIEVESTGEAAAGGHKNREVLKARRVGDCP